LAKTFNFIEVIFKDSNGNFYAKSVQRSNTLKIAVPADTYDGDPGNGDAIMLVGDYNKGSPILFATGKITDPNPQIITAAGEEITFTLYPLVFDITGGTPVSFTVPSNVGFREVTSGNYRGTKYFSIPTDDIAGTITATVTITSAVGSATEHLEAVSPVVNVQPWNWPIPLIMGSDPFSTPPTVAGVFAEATITLTVSAGYAQGVSGLTAISFDVPVKGFEDSSDNPNAETWHIKTGLSNAHLDEGGDDNRSMGGALLLELGTTGLTEHLISSGGL
jgi:hypothetical protein